MTEISIISNILKIRKLYDKHLLNSFHCLRAFLYKRNFISLSK